MTSRTALGHERSTAGLKTRVPGRASLERRSAFTDPRYSYDGFSPLDERTTGADDAKQSGKRFLGPGRDGSGWNGRGGEGRGGGGMGGDRLGRDKR
jgi:hypothetical protein